MAKNKKCTHKIPTLHTDHHKYKFIVYAQGQVIDTKENLTINQARNFFVNNYSDNLALRLFRDDEKIIYGDTPKVLKLQRELIGVYNSLSISHVTDAFNGKC